MKYFALTLFILLGSYTVIQAQESQTLYVKNGGVYVDDLDDADFIRILKAPDSGSTLFGVREYNKNGVILSMGYCKDPRSQYIIYEDQYVSFHPNGKKKKVASYSNGEVQDIEYLFYPNGKLYLAKLHQAQKKGTHLPDRSKVLIQKVMDSTGNVLLTDGNGYYIEYNDDFTKIEVEGTYVNSKWHGTVKGLDESVKSSYIETYNNGKLISGISTDSAGKQYPYKEISVAGEFDTGPKSFDNLLQKEIESVAKKKKLKGKMILSFTINHLGQIESAKIVRTLDTELDEKILSVLNSGIVFKPALIRGMPCSAKYHFPIKVDFEEPARDPYKHSQNPRRSI